MQITKHGDRRDQQRDKIGLRRLSLVIGVGRHEDHFEEGSKAVNMLTRALGCVLFSAQTQSPAVTTSIGG
jgi:hypothetical protein